MKKWTLLIGCGTLAAIGIVLGLWLGGSDDSGPTAASVAESLYDETFDSLEEMLALDDTVAIVGRVTSAYASERIGDGVLFTERIVHVDQVLHGTLADPEAKRIKVRQIGGTIGRETLKLVDARLLMNNEHVVLVLHHAPEIDVYWIKGGGDGHFLIDDAGLRHANYDGTDHPLAAFARGIGTKPLRSVFTENTPN